MIFLLPLSLKAMSSLRPSERLIRVLAFSTTLLLYAGGGFGIGWNRHLFELKTPPTSGSALHLSFTQIKLVAVEDPPPQKKPELLSPEEVDVALEERVKEPDPKPEKAEAFVSQEATAPKSTLDPDALLAWVREQMEKEKEYPITAQRAGYEGRFNLLIQVGIDGRIDEAHIESGKGHPLLRRSVEKIIKRLPGRSFGQPLDQAVELPFDFIFQIERR